MGAIITFIFICMVLTITTVVFGILALRLYMKKFRHEIWEQNRAAIEESNSYTDSRIDVIKKEIITKKLLKK